MKRVLLFVALFTISFVGKAQQNYDFSAVAETGQTLWYQITSNDEVSLIGYEGDMIGEIVLPETVEYGGNNYSVAAIGDSAFYHCDSLTGDLTIPTTVKSVGAMAFYACRNFDGVLTLPNTITHLGEGAFWWCESLTGTVRFPNHLTEIDSLVLYYCHSIEAIEIPASVTHIARRSLSGSSVMTSIMVDEDNPYYYSENNALIERESKELIAGCMTTVIPGDVVSIAPYAFIYCGDGGDLVIPESVKSIGEAAFSFSRFSGSLTLPENLTSIGDYAFMASRFQGELILPEGLLYLPNYTFNTMSVTSVTIPSSIQYVGAGCFWDCHISQSMKVNCVVPPELEEDSFKNVDKDIPVYIPAGTMLAYRNARYWEQFNNFIERGMIIDGAEWYYEIQNDNGSITYQHLKQEGDTVINHKDVKIIVRTNTLYDKHQEITHEYVYEENNVVYWWDKENENFTVLYDQNAEVGDEWQITNGSSSIIVRVDEVSEYEYEGRTFKMMHISDENDVFTGNIVCGIGHLSSFFPEKIMRKSCPFVVESLRCYWVNDDLFFHQGDTDCDEILTVEENVSAQDSESIALYPNPTNGTLYIESQGDASIFSISNMLGQTVMTGNIADSQTIDVSGLDDGMYFICIGQRTVKFVVRK